MENTLVELLAESANRTPGAEAIVHDGRRTTYGELWDKVAGISEFLVHQGLQKGERVALLCENSLEYVASYYGILAANGVVVALNVATKSHDILNWIEHSGALWLIVDEHHQEFSKLLEQCEGLKLIVVSHQPMKVSPAKNLTLWNHIAESCSDCTAIRDPNNLDDAAAIIYTSGTTGDPKGVVLSHRNLVSNMTAILAYLKLSENDRILNVLPFYYSYGNSVLHTHLMVGACLILENSLAYPHRVVQTMSSERVTSFAGVPSTYALLLSRVELAEYDLSSIRYVTQAGGAMSPAHIARLREQLPHVRFFVMYGQTEATARIAYLPPEKLDEKLGSAGISILGVDVEIRNEHGVALPAGEIGEIYVKGPNIMKAYWRNAEATKRVLCNGWLRTGDLAYVDHEGYIFIQGRNSDIIKAGANRVSPQEIEEVISEIDGVAEVAVVGVADEILGEAIKAVIVVRDGYSVSRRTVLAHCRNKLALYKIPKQVHFVERLPKTASGKIRRYLLVDDKSSKA